MVSATRLVIVFVVQPIIVIFFIVLAYKILSRSKQRLSKIFSGFYISTAIGNIINMIYVLIEIELVTIILNFFTNFFIFFGLIFILVSNLIIFSSSVIYTTEKQNRLIIIYAILLIGMVIFLPFGGVTYNSERDVLVWSLPFFLYVISVFSIVATGPVIQTSLKIYKSFNDKQLQRKWLYYIIGLIGLESILYSLMFANLLNIYMPPTFTAFISVYGLTVVLWVFLLYYGIGRQLKEE